MIPDEAIKRLNTLPLASRDFEIEKDKKAVQLGIESLKRLKWTRECPSQSPFELLPGETEK